MDKRRDIEYERDIKKKVFYMKRWELLKEEKKKHTAELIKEHNKKRMAEEWCRFVEIGTFWNGFKRLFDKQVARALAHRRRVTAINLIRMRWKMLIRRKAKVPR